MSETSTDGLHAKIGRLEQQLESANESIKQSNKSAKDWQDKHAALERDFGTYKTAAEANPHAKQVTSLKGENASLKHRIAFGKAAIARGVAADKLDDLYALSGLKPGEEEVKAEDFDEYLDSARTSRDWAFAKATPAGGEGGENPPAKLPPGPGANRGGDGRPGGKSGSPFTAEQLSDPGFATRNAAAIAKHYAERNAAQTK